MGNDVYTINQLVPARRWTYPIAVVLSDTNTDKNLQVNGIPYKYIMNIGTSGNVNIFWMDGTTVKIWLNQGQEIEGGWWQHARDADTDAGVELRGLIGMPGLGV